MNPRFGRRSWVKLWVNEWLDGTTRFEMTDSQRAFWIDLLAMAGRSRFPGVICAGKTPEGKFVGYPVNKLQSLMSEPIDVEETLTLFQRTGKISIEITCESPLRLIKIELLNWTKYQSEYQRQKKYRKPKLQPSDPQSDSPSNKTEVEGEVEGDGEVEEEEKPAQASPSRFAFDNALLQVTQKQDAVLGEAFPWVNRQHEYRYITSWLEANPDRRPKNSTRFLHNWFAKIEKPKQEKANAADERTRRNLKTLGFTV